MRREPPPGSDIQISHSRYIGEDLVPMRWLRKQPGSAKLGSFIEAKGGLTVVVVYPPGRAYSTMGVAECSKKDNFCKKIGRDIALGRALKQLDA